jgi:hypothetical protein
MINFNYSQALKYGTDSYFTQKNLDEVIQSGVYAALESDSAMDEIKGFSEIQKNDNFKFLAKRLTDLNLPHLQTLGGYESITTTRSVFVIKSKEMSLEKFYEIILDLGKSFKQESVIISSKGHVKLIFTTGENKGKMFEGEGFDNTSRTNFLEMPTSDGKTKLIGRYKLDRENLKELTTIKIAI